MREIIFRGRGNCKYNDGDWYYGVPIQDIDGDWQICTYNYKRVVLPDTIGQYTGLTDKNGKKIFEGDILREAYHPECDTMVEYNDGSFRFKSIHSSGWTHQAGEYMSLCFVQKVTSNLRIIGNEFDNPDLLRAGGEDIGKRRETLRPTT